MYNNAERITEEDVFVYVRKWVPNRYACYSTAPQGREKFFKEILIFG